MKKTCFILILIVVMSFLPYSFALTPEQIIQLKKAGVSDETIQIMLKQEKEGAREIKDDQGNVYIIYSTCRSSQEKKKNGNEEEKVRRAWRMLENIIIDSRQ